MVRQSDSLSLKQTWEEEASNRDTHTHRERERERERADDRQGQMGDGKGRKGKNDNGGGLTSNNIGDQHTGDERWRG